MSKSRKVLGALLAVVMVLSILSVSAFAITSRYEDDPSDYSQRWSLGTPVKVSSNQYRVDVILSTDYEVGPVSFRLEGVSTIVDVVPGAAYYTDVNIDKADSGLILLVPDTSETVPAEKVNGTVATVTYTTNAANGAVSIEKSAKTAKNPEGSLIAARCTGGTINVSDLIAGQYTYVNGELLNEGTTPPPAETPVLTGVGTGVVDEAKGFVYGIPATTSDITTLFEVSGSGVIDVEPNAQDKKNATGARLIVYKDSSKAEVVSSYQVVIFGDVNGDGALTLEDASKVAQVANYLSDPFTGAYLFAADVTCDSAITLEDASRIAQVANYLKDPITNPWA